MAGGGNFILVEMDPAIARDVTAERLRLVGAPFRYCTLGDTLFDGDGSVRPEVNDAALAHHLYFTATGEPLQTPVPDGGTLIGTLHDVGYHLSRGAFDLKRLHALTPDGCRRRVVWADSRRITPDRLEAERVELRLVPYDVDAA